MNLLQFETAVSNEIGLHPTDEKTTLDDAINVAVQRVLEDTHCYVKRTDYTGFDGSSQDYTLDVAILEIESMYFTSSAGTKYDLDRVSIESIIEMRRAGTPTGTPSQFYAVSGANLLMFYPAPGAGDTLSVYNVPIPSLLAGPTDDPSTNTFGGVPQILHRAIFYFACSECGSYDDDQSSAQGQRYRDWYDKELTRYKSIIRKRGGNRLARAVVNDKRRNRAFHTNDIYPGA